LHPAYSQRTFAESKKYDSTRKAQREEALGQPKQKPAARDGGDGGATAAAAGGAEEAGEGEQGEEEAEEGETEGAGAGAGGLTAEQIAANR
jgi:hypothetical protein